MLEAACTLEKLLLVRLRELLAGVWPKKLITSNFTVVVTIGITVGVVKVHQGVALLRSIHG
jgi:hypothetical protein